MSEEICGICGEKRTPWMFDGDINKHICPDCAGKKIRNIVVSARMKAYYDRVENLKKEEDKRNGS